MSYHGLLKVISGGQTGADQGGLIAAHRLGVQTGGTCPAGWATTAGPNPLLELLKLKAVGTLKSRTERNVQDSDGTVILTMNAHSPGSITTRAACVKHNKPYLDIDLGPFIAEHQQGTPGAVSGTSMEPVFRTICQWIIEHQIGTLNVAGNREQYPDLLITSFTALAVTGALRLLDLDGLLVRDSDL